MNTYAILRYLKFCDSKVRFSERLSNVLGPLPLTLVAEGAGFCAQLQFSKWSELYIYAFVNLLEIHSTLFEKACGGICANGNCLFWKDVRPA